MSTSIGVVYDVGEAVDGLRVGIGPLQGDLDVHLPLISLLGAKDVQNLFVNNFFLLVHRLNVFSEPTVVLVLDFDGFFTTEVTQHDL